MFYKMECFVHRWDSSKISCLLLQTRILYLYYPTPLPSADMLAASWLRMTRAGCLLPRVTTRTIFSHGRLGIDPSLFVESEASLQPGQTIFKEKVKQNFVTSGLRNVLTDDIDKFIALSVSGEDLEVAGSMVLEVAKDEVLQSIQPNSELDLFLSFNQACHLLDKPQEASQAWAGLKEGSTPASSNRLYKASIVYQDLLLKHGLHEELLQFFSLHEHHLLKFTASTLPVLLALYKLGTRESLARSVGILFHHAGDKRGKWLTEKMAIATALHAFKLEEYAKAQAILQQTVSRTFINRNAPLLIASLQMQVMAHSDRLDEAVELLRGFVPRKVKRLVEDGRDGNKRVVIYSAVESVVAAASGAEKEVFAEVMELVEKIEESADVVEGTMEEILFKEIELREKTTSAVSVDD